MGNKKRVMKNNENNVLVGNDQLIKNDLISRTGKVSETNKKEKHLPFA
ncbi:hypothetical protein HYU21_04550 [Candidatus Woesearchaeota archaeon]|nr:hypothetical protein [Candidatus Woesearchaeota archaeon]